MRKVEIVGNSRDECYQIIGQIAGIQKHRAQQFCKVTQKGEKFNTIEGMINGEKYVATYPKVRSSSRPKRLDRSENLVEEKGSVRMYRHYQLKDYQVTCTEPSCKLPRYRGDNSIAATTTFNRHVSKHKKG